MRPLLRGAAEILEGKGMIFYEAPAARSCRDSRRERDAFIRAPAARGCR